MNTVFRTGALALALLAGTALTAAPAMAGYDHWGGKKSYYKKHSYNKKHHHHHHHYANKGYRGYGKGYGYRNYGWNPYGYGYGYGRRAYGWPGFSITIR